MKKNVRRAYRKDGKRGFEWKTKNNVGVNSMRYVSERVIIPICGECSGQLHETRTYWKCDMCNIIYMKPTEEVEKKEYE